MTGKSSLRSLGIMLLPVTAWLASFIITAPMIGHETTAGFLLWLWVGILLLPLCGWGIWRGSRWGLPLAVSYSAISILLAFHDAGSNIARYRHMDATEGPGNSDEIAFFASAMDDNRMLQPLMILWLAILLVLSWSLISSLVRSRHRQVDSEQVA